MSAARRARRLDAKLGRPAPPTPTLNVVDLMLAAAIGRRLPELEAADVVMAVLPSAQRVLVKGKVRLTAITASGIKRECVVQVVPVPSAEAAAALEQVLGGDGAMSAGTGAQA